MDERISHILKPGGKNVFALKHQMLMDHILKPGGKNVFALARMLTYLVHDCARAVAPTNIRCSDLESSRLQA